VTRPYFSPVSLIVSCIFLATTFVCSSTVIAENSAKEKITNSASEEIKRYSNDDALKISQAAIGKSVGHYQFTSTDGKKVSIKDYLGKPLIVSLIYTSCYHICPTTTENLNRVVEKAKDVLGEDSFNVVTIGFDTQIDTPQAMEQFASLHSSPSDNWSFLSSDAATMDALVRDIGFIYSPSPHGFDHLIMASILDNTGTVYRQVYGIRPQTPHFVEPIKELVFGKSKEDSLFSAISSKIKLFCTVYDPAQDKYYFNYSIFVGVFVGLVLGLFFLRLFIKEWRYTKNANKQ